MLQVRVREQGQDRSSSSLALTTTPGPLTPEEEEETAGDHGAYINYNIATTPSSPPYLNITQELPNTSQDGRHEYENIEPALQSPDYLPTRLVLPPKPPHLQPSPDSPQEQAAGQAGTVNSINYIVLDLDTNNTNNTEESPVTTDTNTATPDTTTRARGYVTIDFDKTDALIKSANQRYVVTDEGGRRMKCVFRFFGDDDPGTRKTRHNSSLSDLAPVKLVN